MRPKTGCKHPSAAWVVVWLEVVLQDLVDGAGKGLEALEFKRTESEWGLYYRTGSRDQGPALLLAYVDGIVVAAQSNDAGRSQSWGRCQPF
jgi:hypothetical protein